MTENINAFATFVDVLSSRSSEKRGFNFLGLDGQETASLSYAELDLRARALAVEIRRVAAPGDRALLLYTLSNRVLDIVVVGTT